MTIHRGLYRHDGLIRRGASKCANHLPSSSREYERTGMNESEREEYKFRIKSLLYKPEPRIFFRKGVLVNPQYIFLSG